MKKNLNVGARHGCIKRSSAIYCNATKKKLEIRPVEEAKKIKYDKRLKYKRFVQVSGLCGPQFLSYLPKRFTHLCRALYGDAILVHQYGRRKSTKTYRVHFCYKSSFFLFEN